MHDVLAVMGLWRVRNTPVRIRLLHVQQLGTSAKHQSCAFLQTLRPVCGTPTLSGCSKTFFLAIFAYLMLDKLI